MPIHLRQQIQLLLGSSNQVDRDGKSLRGLPIPDQNLLVVHGFWSKAENRKKDEGWSGWCTAVEMSMMIQARLDINHAKNKQKTHTHTRKHKHKHTQKKTQNPDYSRNQGIVQK